MFCVFVFGDEYGGYSKFQGKIDFFGHALGDVPSKVPQLITCREQRESGTNAELSLRIDIVIKKLCKIDVRSHGDIAEFSDNVSAIEFCHLNIVFYITTQR